MLSHHGPDRINRFLIPVELVGTELGLTGIVNVISFDARSRTTRLRVDDETILIKSILLPYSPTTAANSGGHGGIHDEVTVVLLLIESLPRASLKLNKFRTITGVFLIRSRVFWLYQEA